MPTHLIWDNIFSNEPWIFMWSLIWYRGILQKMVVFLKLSELGILLWNCFKLYYFFFAVSFLLEFITRSIKVQAPNHFLLDRVFQCSSSGLAPKTWLNKISDFATAWIGGGPTTTLLSIFEEFMTLTFWCKAKVNNHLRNSLEKLVCAL